MELLKKLMENFPAWRDGWAIKSIDCPSRGPWFSSHHVNWDISVSPVLGNLMLSPDLQNRIKYSEQTSVEIKLPYT